MRLRITLITSFILLGFLTDLIAQGKLVYINGKEKRFSTAEVRGEFVVFKPEGDHGSGVRKIEKYDIFSIVRDNGVEEIVYSPDTIEEGDPTIAEVRDYIKGEQLADSIYHKPANFISGVVLGGAGSAIGFYGLVVPVAYTTILGRFTPKVPKDLQAANNFSQSFQAGYEKKARNKKITSSLIGGGIGFAVGFSALIIILGNN